MTLWPIGNLIALRLGFCQRKISAIHHHKLRSNYWRQVCCFRFPLVGRQDTGLKIGFISMVRHHPSLCRAYRREALLRKLLLSDGQISVLVLQTLLLRRGSDGPGCPHPQAARRAAAAPNLPHVLSAAPQPANMPTERQSDVQEASEMRNFPRVLQTIVHLPSDSNNGQGLEEEGISPQAAHPPATSLEHSGTPFSI